MSAVTTDSYKTRMTTLETQMDDIQVSFEHKLDQFTQDMQLSLQTQLQTSMQDIMKQLQFITDGQDKRKLGEAPARVDSPGSLSAGLKHWSSGDIQETETTHKRRPHTRSMGKGQEEDTELQDTSLES